MGFRAAVRAGTMTLLDGYRIASSGALKQTHRTRPVSLMPPAAFIDAITERIEYTPAGAQRTPEVQVRIVRGTYAKADVADDTDVIVDDFIAYAVANRYAAGPNTLLLVSSVDDDDGWIPEWMPQQLQQQYFTTVVTLSAEGLFGGVV